MKSHLAQNSNVPRSQENNITEVFKEIEEKVTKKLFREFSRTENCILGALSRLYDFLMNPLIQGHSEPLRRRHRTDLAQTRERMKTTPRVVFILKQASSTTRRRETLAQKTATTW